MIYTTPNVTEMLELIELTQSQSDRDINVTWLGHSSAVKHVQIWNDDRVRAATELNWTKRSFLEHTCSSKVE